MDIQDYSGMDEEVNFILSPIEIYKIMSTIVHFDISAKDTDRAKKFYDGLFGWKITPWRNQQG
jgi:hypothetical protein